MELRYLALDNHGRSAFSVAYNFLKERLAERETIEWALRLAPDQHAERTAIAELLDHPNTHTAGEPWLTAWNLIRESWSLTDIDEDNSKDIYDIQRRLRSGDRSSSVINSIVKLVQPYLRIEPNPSRYWQLEPPPRKPKSYRQLLSTSVTSGRLVDLDKLELASLTEVSFLTALARALEHGLRVGIDIARQLGLGDHDRWQQGNVARVHYVPPAQPGDADPKDEPDSYHRGLAPIIKLLHAVVMRIAELDIAAASRFVAGWRIDASPFHTRLWAAIARNPSIASAEEVGSFLLALNNDEFWNLHLYPEFADLRAKRFSSLDHRIQSRIIRRIQKGPPKSLWPRSVDVELARNARQHWSVRELKRIEVAGGQLAPAAQEWLDALANQLDYTEAMVGDEGFPTGVIVRWVPPNPDLEYDTLEGLARLRALEAAFSTSRDEHGDKADRADDWIRQSDNATHVLNDLAAAGNERDEFARVWDRFGWAHSSTAQLSLGKQKADLQREANRVLGLIVALSTKTLTAAVRGLSAWLDDWSRYTLSSPIHYDAWQRMWPIAAAATNAESEEPNDFELSASLNEGTDQGQTRRIDTLNPPAGKLVGYFLVACPSLNDEPQPFSIGSGLRMMRDTIVRSDGRSGLIARHRLTEALPYFLKADRAWTEEHLVAPLLAKDEASLSLWGAITRQNLSTEAMRIIGPTMAERAADPRLDRDTRQRLVFSLVVEQLHAFRRHAGPAVPHVRITQMLRTVDDEVRGAAAQAIHQFVNELSSGARDDANALSAAELFRSAAAPFLQLVWPQERSLTTPSVSGALAELPASSGEAFAEAVDVIERFLVPFSCWSMLDYGLHRSGNRDVRSLDMIDDQTKSAALLSLLDLTVGSDDSAVIPHDLTDALDRVRSVAPQLVTTVAFQRLSTVARR